MIYPVPIHQLQKVQNDIRDTILNLNMLDAILPVASSEYGIPVEDHQKQLRRTLSQFDALLEQTNQLIDKYNMVREMYLSPTVYGPPSYFKDED